MPDSLVSMPSEAHRDFNPLNWATKSCGPRQGNNLAVPPKGIHALHRGKAWTRFPKAQSCPDPTVHSYAQQIFCCACGTPALMLGTGQDCSSPAVHKNGCLRLWLALTARGTSTPGRGVRERPDPRVTQSFELGALRHKKWDCLQANLNLY